MSPVDHTQPGCFVILPSGRVVEIARHVDGHAECRYLGTSDYTDLRIDWLRRHGRPYAVNTRGGK